METNIPIIEGDFIPISDQTLYSAYNSLFKRLRISYYVGMAIFALAFGLLAVSSFIHGKTVSGIFYVVMGCVLELIYAKFVFRDIPKKINAGVAQTRKLHSGTEHYVYYSDRRVVTGTENTHTVRYEEIFKAQELKDCWVFYVGEENSWSLLIVAKESYTVPGHFEKALELLLQYVPEKNIKPLIKRK